MARAYRLIIIVDTTASVMPVGADMPVNELIFAIPQALASMEEHVSMHWTRLFVTVRCDTRENIVEMTSASVVTSTQTA